MASRWDRLLDVKAISLAEHLVEEVSKLLAKDLARWPLPVLELDVETGRQFAPLLAPDSQRPDPPAFGEAFRLARWELEREIEAVDDYMRNRRWLERGLAPDDKQALLFISRWLVEQLLGLAEATEGRLSRPTLVEALNRTERRLNAAAASG